MFSFLAGAKHSVVADPTATTTSNWSTGCCPDGRRGGVVAGSKVVRASKRFTPEAICRSHPHLIVTSITPFGLEVPGETAPATEFTLQAWSGGIVGLGRGHCRIVPRCSSVGRSGSTWPERYAQRGPWCRVCAIGRRGAGELIDLSMLEAQILCLTYYPVTYFEMLGRPWRGRPATHRPGRRRAKDGLVDLGCGTAQQWFDLCAMVGHPEWIDEESAADDHGSVANAQADEIYPWVASQTVDEIRELATAFRIPNAPVANGANIAALDHFAGAPFVHPTTRATGFSSPDILIGCGRRNFAQPQPAPRLGERHRLPAVPGRPASTARPAAVPRKMNALDGFGCWT